jgi:GDP-4-dehydro-6-deoxy-D-mannose reductase
LVTGCGGFVGPYVIKALVREGYEVWGVDIEEPNHGFAGQRYVSLDLSNRAAVDGLLEQAAPSAIVHLAAQSSAGRSFQEPITTLTRNILPILYLLEFARKRATGARILAVGSADVYGSADQTDIPLKETSPAKPLNPYALSKAIQEQCCVQYASLYGTDVVLTRSFNHTGEGQRDVFVLSSFARQISEIRMKVRKPVVEVGNVDLRRDFTDVRDVARAYAALLRDGKRGEVYNVCSGVSYSLRELLETMCRIAGVVVDIRVDSGRVRPADIMELRGDSSKITRDTGWSPAIPIDDTLKSLLDFWSGTIQEARREDA